MRNIKIINLINNTKLNHHEVYYINFKNNQNNKYRNASSTNTILLSIYYHYYQLLLLLFYFILLNYYYYYYYFKRAILSFRLILILGFAGPHKQVLFFLCSCFCCAQRSVLLCCIASFLLCHRHLCTAATAIAAATKRKGKWRAFL